MNIAPPRRRNLGVLFSLAWRESRSARRRLLLYMSAISLGVAALVAIDSYAGNVTRSVQEQSRALLGGDLAFSTRNDFTPAADSVLDSLAASGAEITRTVSFASMVLVPRAADDSSGGGTRLVQVRAVEPAFPFYGEIVTAPAGRWAMLQQGRNALVDPSILVSLDASVGDTIALGYARFAIIGTLQAVPGDAGVAAAIAPRVFIPMQWVDETRLLGFGSRADHDAFARLADGVNPSRFVIPWRERIEAADMRVRTVAQQEDNFTESIEELSDFLSIVGLVALLLGGIGVASGVHAFVARKLVTAAVLRCLGATSGQVLLIYVTQAALMGLAGAAIGVALGIAIQFALPGAVRDFMPVNVTVRLEPRAILSGLVLGTWIALAFALRPLVTLRTVSPLQALRRDTDPAPVTRANRDVVSLLVTVLLAASVVAVAATRAQSTRDLLVFTVGIAVALAALWLSAGFLSMIARRSLRARWPYVVRQGVANLYRPANQTRAVVLSLGFGSFLITTLYLVQTNLLRQFQLDADASRANLVFFDVQEDQADGVAAVLAGHGQPVLERTPIVTMRIASVNGRTVDELLADSTGYARWALRREYRSTYRDTMHTSERIIAGEPFGAAPTGGGGAPYEVSLERDLAEELRVGVGDEIRWNVQGAEVDTRITSLREVDWARFETNFFAVFAPAAIRDAPQQFVILSAVPEPATLTRIQRDVVTRYPNVSSLDLTLIRKTIQDVVDKVAVAIRFLAVFSLAMGVPVLFSAVAATRRERVREGVLLKTLGATRRQVERMLLAEYALLGLLGAGTGMLLSFGGAWAILRWVFEREFVPATVPALVIAAAMVLLTTGIGLLSGRDVFRETPMAALRNA
jgi:putative ABC transport system permease protein